MNNILRTLLSLLFVFCISITRAQEIKHTINFGIGTVLPFENSIYVDFDEPDYEIWADPEHTFAWHLDYTYHLTHYIGINGYVEFEKIQLENYFFGDLEANRSAFGGGFELSYPQTPLHGLSGGFFGFGAVNSDDFDNSLKGFEYGLFVGPAYTLSRFELALLFRPKFSYFFAKELYPEAGLLMYPQVFLKIGYNS